MFDAKQVTMMRPRAVVEHALEVGADDRLALRDARAVGVGGVAAEQQQALATHLGQPRHVGRRAADRRLVELVVAREEHGAERAGQRDAARVGDRVREVDALERERAGLHAVADRQHLEVDLAQLVLVELGARHRDRQLAAVDDRHGLLAELAQHPRQRPEVVLVAVGDHDRLDPLHVVPQVREVGQDEVDAHHVRRREPQAAVDDDDAPVVLDDGHVLADLPHAAEGENAQLAAHPVWAPLNSPWRSSIAWTFARSSSLASTSGSRKPPTSWPSMFSAALTGIGLAVQNRVS